MRVIPQRLSLSLLAVLLASLLVFPDGMALAQQAGGEAAEIPDLYDQLADVRAESATEPGDEAPEDQPAGAEGNLLNRVADATFSSINDVLATVLFFDITFGLVEKSGDPEAGSVALPLIVAVLALGAVFFSLFYRFITFRGLRHSIDVIRGRYDNKEDDGEISHFHALTSALSATVGLGNIAGVALAIAMGGPGAIVWMVGMALFGMASKFSSCTLSQLYRQVNPDGTISGGPMYYLDLGLKQYGPAMGFVGKVLAVLYAVMVMGGALGGGNMFQSNQAYAIVQDSFGITWQYADELFGLFAAVMVGIVVLGGIKRIGKTTARIVPAMAVIYVLACLAVIVMNIGAVPAAFGQIIAQAFTLEAGLGGLVGTLVVGVQRAAFSNEAGLGSAAIAHAAAKTREPVREGIVAMIGPMVDTVIICTMTALAVVVTGVFQDASIGDGVTMTSAAFQTVMPGFRFILTIAVLLFAYSTMISWCYYGERGWIYLLDHAGGIGLRTVFVFRLVFVFFVFFGTITNLGAVLLFSDLMILSMAFPNIIGSVLLAPLVWPVVRDYWRRYKAGEMA